MNPKCYKSVICNAVEVSKFDDHITHKLPACCCSMTRQISGFAKASKFSLIDTFLALTLHDGPSPS
jgi:hypothetical protein